MAWELTGTKTQKITQQLAQSFVDMEPAPHDRILSERRLQIYERLLRVGQFRPLSWGKVLCAETGLTYRVNGKHTAILFSNLSNEFPDHQVTIESYSCDTLEDVGRLYGTYDSTVASRSSADINKAFAATMPELASVPLKIINSCASGMTGHLSGGNFNGPAFGSPPERAERLLEHYDFVLWVRDLVPDTKKHEHLLRIGSVAAMFACYSKSKKAAVEFWERVRDENGPRPTCPDRQLSRWLLTSSVRAGNDRDIASSRRTTARQMYAICIKQWNLWRDDEEGKLLKHARTDKIPVAK